MRVLPPRQRARRAAADEREVFELLIAVSGIGPNSALTILSGMTLRDLQDAILQERVNELTQIKGIGRKTLDKLRPLVTLDG